MTKKLIMAALMFVLAACASDDSSDTDKKEAKESKKAAKEQYKTDDLICPQVAILQQASQIIDYGNGADTKSFAAKTRMRNVDGDCGYQDNGIDISFNLTITADAGGRPMKKPQYTLPYFVAVVDPNENILSKKMMSVSFELGKDKHLEHTEPLHVLIPLTKPAMISGPDYRVLVGFDMMNQKTPKATP